jgi:hypothetical protein
MSSTSTPEGSGSVSGAPNLPEGFADTFTSRYVDAGEVRLHAVVGGDGPPLLLIHGWPGSWYYWRLVMPALARDFTVVAVDQRGIGLSDKPEKGYDAGTLANDFWTPARQWPLALAARSRVPAGQTTLRQASDRSSRGGGSLRRPGGLSLD